MIVTKTFESERLVPLSTPDGTSLEEQVNLFLSTLPDKAVLDILVEAFSSQKYGTRKTFVAVIMFTQ